MEELDRKLATLRNDWPHLVEKCLVLQPALKRDLRDSWPLRLTGTTLTIGFDPEFPGVMEEVKLLDHGGLHKLFSNLLGRSIRIDYQVMKEAVTWSHHVPEVKNAASDTASRAVSETASETASEAASVDTEGKPFSVEEAGNNPEAWIRNQSVRQVLEVFHGDIIDIQR